MKKGLLTLLSIAICFSVVAQQVREALPFGFQRAQLPAEAKTFTKKPLRKAVDNVTLPTQQGPVNTNPPMTTASSVDEEYLIGLTFYDLQTNNSISNRLVRSDDGTMSAAFTLSPNSTSGFPQRGSGYNYWDGSTWIYAGTTREESIRTGFTNIVVTPISELLISHNIYDAATDENQIVVAYRMGKGSGTWTETFPWGPSFDTWPKAVSAGTSGSNNRVYVIFQGSGAGTTTHIVEGQNGPIYFARSDDGGVTWGPKRVIDLIDSTHYSGFGGDSYSIDARGDTVAISIADTYTDVILLKSYDGGDTWTKKIIQKHPIPFYATCNCGTYYIPNAQDTTVDTVYSNAGDSKVMLDNNGLAHVWFSDFAYYDDDSTDNLYFPFDGSDGLYYWNENMPEDVGGTRPYYLIASSQDFNGNGTIDIPTYDFATLCSAQRNNWGDYSGGVTQMPSAGIDSNGTIYLTYHALAEYPAADTAFYHMVHRHVYMMTLPYPYDPYSWTYPYDIVPSGSEGGDGENQEAVFACVAKNVGTTHVDVLYQRDGAPGHALAQASTCDLNNNYGNSSDLVHARVDMTTVGIKTTNSNDLFMSQNYPNPAKGQTFVNLALKKAAKVNIEVTDVVGKVVYSEAFGNVASGNMTITLNTANWEAGLYNYTVTAGGDKSTRQMIVQ